MDKKSSVMDSLKGNQIKPMVGFVNVNYNVENARIDKSTKTNGSKKSFGGFFKTVRTISAIADVIVIIGIFVYMIKVHKSGCCTMDNLRNKLKCCKSSKNE